MQDLDVILAGFFVPNLQQATLLAGVVDGTLDVQLHFRPKLVGVETEPPEGHLELPDVQHIVVPEVSVRPLTGHPQGGTILLPPE